MLWCCHSLNQNIINFFSGYVSGYELSVVLGSSHRWKILVYTKACFLGAEAKYIHHHHYNCILSGELYTYCWIFDGSFSVRLGMCVCSKANLLNLCRELLATISSKKKSNPMLMNLIYFNGHIHWSILNNLQNKHVP